MELKVDIGFDQLLRVIKQLPEAKIIQLKAELSNQQYPAKHSNHSQFQHLLLNGPVMDDEQYQHYKELRKRLNKWSKK